MHFSLLDQKCHSLFFHLVLLLTPSYVTHGLLDYCLKACGVCTQCVAHSGSDEAFTGSNNQINNCIRVQVLQGEIVHTALVRLTFFFWQHINYRLTWVTRYSIWQWCQKIKCLRFTRSKGQKLICCAIVFFLSIYQEDISHLIWYWLVRVTMFIMKLLIVWVIRTYHIWDKKTFLLLVFCFLFLFNACIKAQIDDDPWVIVCIFESQLSISALTWWK